MRARLTAASARVPPTGTLADHVGDIHKLGAHSLTNYARVEHGNHMGLERSRPVRRRSRDGRHVFLVLKANVLVRDTYPMNDVFGWQVSIPTVRNKDDLDCPGLRGIQTRPGLFESLQEHASK